MSPEQYLHYDTEAVSRTYGARPLAAEGTMDFYAILKSAIADSNADDATRRAALYERARQTLDTHLDSTKPTASAAARREQREGLENAIRRIEAECGGKTEPAEAPSTAPARSKPAEMDKGSVKLEKKESRYKYEQITPARTAKVAGSAAEDAEADAGDPPRPHGRPLGPVALLVLLVIAVGGALIYWQWDRVGAFVASLTKPIEESDMAAAGTQPAERAYLLVEQDQQSAENQRFAGTALWSVGGSGAETSLAIAISFPEQSAELSLVFRANTDVSLPASHTIDFSYSGPDESDGAVTDVAGLLVRSDNSDAPVPLRGVDSQVAPGQFLIGLSGTPTDRDHNTSHLQSGDWLLIPIRFASERRSVVVIEKGQTGDKAMNQAFAAWKGAQISGQNR